MSFGTFAIPRCVVALPTLLVCCIAVVVAGPTPRPALAAGVALNTGGFESPYTVDNLTGQVHGWIQSNSSGSSTATVQDNTVYSGSQAVTVHRPGGVGTDRRWYAPLSSLPTQRFITVDWQMRVAPTTIVVPEGDDQFGPFFGIESYDDLNESSAKLLGSLGVDASTGDVLFQIQDSGFLTVTGSVAAFNQWNHFRLIFDFQTDTYRGYFNGVQVASTGFVDRSAGLDDFSDVDIAALAAQGDAFSQNLPGTAHFDNLLVRDGLPGDYNADGAVNSADYTTWKAAFGATVSPGSGADGNYNGVIDAGDFAVWRDSLALAGSFGSGSSDPFDANLVPEPAGVLLVVLSLPFAARRAFRRRQR